MLYAKSFQPLGHTSASSLPLITPPPQPLSLRRSLPLSYPCFFFLSSAPPPPSPPFSSPTISVRLHLNLHLCLRPHPLFHHQRPAAPSLPHRAITTFLSSSLPPHPIQPNWLSRLSLPPPTPPTARRQTHGQRHPRRPAAHCWSYVALGSIVGGGGWWTPS